MRYFALYIVLFFINTSTVFGQCFPERHNTAWYDGWISCEVSDNPNTTREASHWIMYNFGTVLEMYNFTVWNVNAPNYLDHGIQVAYLDYSVDGETWLEYGEVTLPQATGENTYEGLEVLNFNGIEAQYLLITAKTTYGSDCAGLAEIKLEVDSTETLVPIDTTSQTEQDSICIIADVFPNPMVTNELFITLTQQCVNAVHYTVTDAMGRIVVQITPIALNETAEVFKGIDLPAGVYIVELTSNYAKSEYKVVKQ